MHNDDIFVIQGGRPLKGAVTISGAKNAAVAILPATILAQGVCVIDNIPQISDVTIMLEILRFLGAEIKSVNPHKYEIDTAHLRSQTVPHEMTKHLRASYYLIGAMLGRFGSAKVASPGGCDFGIRPIDQHLKGFELLGAEVSYEQNAIIEIASKKLIGSQVYFDKVSVGATINVMLAAVKAEGLTVIENAAKEPHVVDLANFLNMMGADIWGAGTDTIKIRGNKPMRGCDYTIIPDQIEAGTYMIAAAATHGDVKVKNIISKHLESLTAKLKECGVQVEDGGDWCKVSAPNPFTCSHIKTGPHPGFPTDLQPQMTVLLCIAGGTSTVTEGVWDNRFKYAGQLLRMGADINVNGQFASIEGVGALRGAPIQADDLRAGAAMIIAGLVAQGETRVENVDHVDRGYEDVVEKLKKLGAKIKRVTPAPVQAATAG